MITKCDSISRGSCFCEKYRLYTGTILTRSRLSYFEFSVNVNAIYAVNVNAIYAVNVNAIYAVNVNAIYAVNVIFWTLDNI